MATDTISPVAERPEPTLTRRLDLGSATALVVGEVIGVGIFLTPAGMARALASPGLLLVVWLVLGAVALAGALCLGALSQRTPEVGGCYVFLKQAYGPGTGFLYGWLSLLVTDPGVTAALATGLATYAASLVDLSGAGQKAVAISAILALAAANMVGRGFGGRLLRGLALLKVALLVALALWGFGMGLGHWSNFMPFWARSPGALPVSEALAGAMVAGFFSFGGWWDASKLAGEIRDPERNMPRALALGVVIVTITYVIVSAAFLYLVPLTQVNSDMGFAAQAGRALFGAAGEQVFAGIVVATVLGSLSAILMAAPRVYYAMAADGLFPAAFAAVHSRFGTPVRATAVQAVLASVLVATGGFENILAYFIFPTLGFLVLTVAAVYLPQRIGNGRGSRSLPGHPITPLIFIVPTVVLMALLAAKDPVRTAAGVGVVAVGLPAYYLTTRRRADNEHMANGLPPD